MKEMHLLKKIYFEEIILIRLNQKWKGFHLDKDDSQLSNESAPPSFDRPSGPMLLSPHFYSIQELT